MVKKKGSREMNPADAFRKSQRQKEITRNKRERKFQRDAHSLQADPDAIKDQLKDVLDQQDNGKVNLTLKLKQRALQGAYDTAIKRKKEEEVKQLQSTDYTFTHAHGHGVLTRAPEDSVYFHPLLNPSGVPPPGKPQRYKTSVRPDLPASELPLPLPPPLPAGPAPGSAPLPPPSGPPPGFSGRPGPEGQQDAAQQPVLPPPSGPPPGVMPLQPPAGPPPGFPVGPPGVPPGAPPGLLPPPAMPPPGYVPGQDYIPPIGPPGAAQRKDVTISGASTVVRIPRAETDKKVTSMVPASVRRAAAPLAPGLRKQLGAAPVGMVPSSALRAPAKAPALSRPGGQGQGVLDQKYKDFMAEMEVLGAV